MAITYSQHADLTLEDIHALTRWEVVSTAARLALVPVEADNDKICHQTDNHSYWILADYTGPTWVEITSAGVAAVTSVFGEIGDVSEADANFTAADIVNVPAGTVAGTDVQAAIDELEAEKAPATHTHVLSQVTDAGTAAAEDVGVTLGDVPQLEDVGGGTPGLPAVDGSQLTGVAGGGSAITVTDEGGAPLTTDVVSFDFVGTGVTASSVGDDVTVTIAAGAAPIDTVFGRTGTVVATPSDYDASQVDNDSTVTGAFVDDALNTLDTDKAATGDARFPTTDEKGALAGTGTPSGSNRYVVDDDSRLVTGAVSAGATVTDHALVRGDGGARGVQDSGISIDDTDNVTGVTTFEVGGVTLDGAGLNETSAGYFFGGADGGASPADNVFTGGTSNSASVKGGANYTRGGIASGATSEGGDLNLYGGTGTSGPGAVRVGGFDATPSASEIEMMKGFSVREASDHPNVTVTGRGQLWARTSDGAIMWTDRDDVDHDLTTSGSGTMAIEDEGTPVSGGPHSTMDFIGAGVTASDAGGGTVSITIAPGAAPIDTVFGRTGTVVAVTGDYTASEVTNVPAGGIAATNVQTAINELDSEKAAAAHTQGYTTINGVPTDTFLGRDTGGTGAAEAMAVATAQSLLNVEDGSVAAGTSGDAYAASHEIDATAHDGDSIVNTPAGNIASFTVQGAINELDTEKAAASHGHTLSDISDSGTAAAEDTGVLIGDLPLLENVGGNPGLPAVDGSQLTGIDTGTPITVIDESTELTTNLNQLTFAGSGVVATEPGTEGEILVTVSGTAGAIDVSDGTTTVSGADLLTFDGTAFDVTDQGGADALVEPAFGSTTGTIAEGDHTHDTLANVAQNVILGRDTAGSGPSEELTGAQAAALLDHADLGTGIGTNTHAQIDTHVDGDGSDHADVATNSAHVADVTTNPHETSLENLEPGTHVHLEQASVDSGKIFASLQTSQVASLTAEASPAATDLLLMERASDGAYRGVEVQDATLAHGLGSDKHSVDTFENLQTKVGNATLLKLPVTPSQLEPGGTTPDGTKVYWGDGTWGIPPGGSVALTGSTGLGQFAYTAATPNAGEFKPDNTAVASTTELQFHFTGTPEVGAVADALLHSILPGDYVYMQGQDPSAAAAVFLVDDISEFSPRITFEVTPESGEVGANWLSEDYTLVKVSGGTAYSNTVGASSYNPGASAPTTSYVQAMASVTPVSLGWYTAEFDGMFVHDSASETVSFEIAKDGTQIAYSERVITSAGASVATPVHIGPIKAEQTNATHVWMVRWKSSATSADLVHHAFTLTKVSANF